MRCEAALVAVSVRADDELASDDLQALDTHLATCEACRQFEHRVMRLRSSLRLEPVDRVPDVAPAVIGRLRSGAEGPASAPVPPAPPERWAARRVMTAAAAAALAGLIGGAAFVGVGTGGRAPAAADVPERVLAAQGTIDALDARYTIAESGSLAVEAGRDGHRRTFVADLTYRAPEAVALRVSETTPEVAAAASPTRSLVVDGERWWSDSTRSCSPATGLVRCQGRSQPWSRAITGREPFSTDAPVPLELVNPVDSFALSARPPVIGRRTVAGREAIGVAVTAAQVAAVLDGFSSVVELRPVHPTDPVELWLDAAHLVPLELVVRAGDEPGRRSWAASVGAADRPGGTLLKVQATALTVNDPASDVSDVPTPPTAADEALDAGFRVATVDDPAVARVPRPTAVPAGLRPYHEGVVSSAGGPTVGVRAWSNGRAWVVVRATADWPGGRVFGDLGPDAHAVDLGRAGTAYVNGDGQSIALHTNGLDVVVRGSLAPARLRDVAASLGLEGLPVPDDWAEASASDRASAAAALPGLLTATELAGYAPPAFHVHDELTDANAAGQLTQVTVIEARSGPGERSFSLTQWHASTLVPPSAGDEVGVDVRGAFGRYSAHLGVLEWVEAGHAVNLQSNTLGLADLLAIADRLEPA